MAEITMKGWECERCEHQWVPRDEEHPRVCPKCKSPYWDRPRLDGTKSRAIKKHFKKKVIKNG